MKELDVSSCDLVFAGQEWTHDKDPCCRDMIKLLERNEKYCTWFQPSGKGLESQFPAIEIRGKYYQLSLRVQKAIFRHVRLHKEFRNIEHVADGRLKLRIPQRLLFEKKRTSNRFTTMHSRHHGGGGVDPRDAGNHRRQPTLSTDELLRRVLLPLFAADASPDAKDGGDKIRHVDPALPAYTSFVFNELESARNMIAQLHQDCPGITASRDVFLAHMARIFDSLDAEGGG